MYEHQIDTPNVKFANDKGGVGNAGFAEENPEVRISSWNIISSTERESYVFFWKLKKNEKSEFYNGRYLTRVSQFQTATGLKHHLPCTA